MPDLYIERYRGKKSLSCLERKPGDPGKKSKPLLMDKWTSTAAHKLATLMDKWTSTAAHKLATFLHPKYKSLKLVNDAEKES